VPGCVRDTTPQWLSGPAGPVGNWSDLGWGALNATYGALKNVVRLAPLTIPVIGPVLEAAGAGNWLANKLPDRIGGGNPKTAMYQTGGLAVNICLLFCTLGAGGVVDTLAIGDRLAALDATADAGSALAATKDLSGIAASRQAGITGENLAGINQAAKVRIPSMTGTAAYRIPDELTNTALTEVKNVGSLRYTNQLRDFYWYANTTGRSFNLIVRTNTILSARLQAMVDAGVINLEPILPGQ